MSILKFGMPCGTTTTAEVGSKKSEKIEKTLDKSTTKCYNKDTKREGNPKNQKGLKAMTNYYINIHENNETETAMFAKAEYENLWGVVVEVMNSYGFIPYPNPETQQNNFYADSVTFWQDTLNDGSLWTLEYEWTSDNKMELYTMSK